ncbi:MULTISPECIES: ribbon-helix-helix domain-containing protein [unclassified Rhizobium]|uniref:ribbon-helix-helix domain-containing protein n=1 Tax=unclassified Rhizobium TaxID=2613769 RepID=UPI0006FCCE69|nr:MULTISPECIES: ribbon-helix-helix domain-containing protein [unclassified Rhizobium]KQV38511.1 arylsulfate sulfotransferase [Rhizobium sp. Root1212]KRD31164.1 arylsulfate sulfotransferase [Rhizobium sp. Root268]
MIRKHSATLHGHRTSFSLEEPFWQELKQIAEKRDMSLARLIAEIDDARAPGSNLSSALRVHVLEWLKRPAPTIEGDIRGI